MSRGADNGRLFAILLALGTPLCAWLLIEWQAEREAPPPAPPRESLAPAGGHQAPPVHPPGTARSDAPPVPASPPEKQPVRCRTGGHTIYTDDPARDCPQGGEVIDARPASRGLQPERSFKEQLARLEETLPAQAQGPRGAAIDRATGAGKRSECAVNAWEQEQVKAALRQLHDAQRGDALTRRLRELTDEAFRLRC